MLETTFVTCFTNLISDPELGLQLSTSTFHMKNELYWHAGSSPMTALWFHDLFNKEQSSHQGPCFLLISTTKKLKGHPVNLYIINYAPSNFLVLFLSILEFN